MTLRALAVIIFIAVSLECPASDQSKLYPDHLLPCDNLFSSDSKSLARIETLRKFVPDLASTNIKWSVRIISDDDASSGDSWVLTLYKEDSKWYLEHVLIPRAGMDHLIGGSKNMYKKEMNSVTADKIVSLWIEFVSKTKYCEEGTGTCLGSGVVHSAFKIGRYVTGTLPSFTPNGGVLSHIEDVQLALCMFADSTSGDETSLIQNLDELEKTMAQSKIYCKQKGE